MPVHLFAEVVPTWCEVENHVEVFLNTLKEAIVKIVSNGRLVFDRFASVLEECQLVNDLLLFFVFALILDSTQGFKRLFLLLLDRNKGCKNVRLSSDLRAHVTLDKTLQVMVPQVVRYSILVTDVSKWFVLHRRVDNVFPHIRAPLFVNEVWVEFHFDVLDT